MGSSFGAKLNDIEQFLSFSHPWQARRVPHERSDMNAAIEGPSSSEASLKSCEAAPRAYVSRMPFMVRDAFWIALVARESLTRAQ